MRVNLDCVPCFMQQALKTARIATDDERCQEKILRETAGLLKNLSYECSPPEIAHQVHEIVRKISGNEDPYREVKLHDNKLALDLYPWLKQQVRESDDPLYTAVKLAVAGNIIDYGVNQTFNVEETVERVLGLDFALNAMDEFRKELDNAREVYYLADNAGEIVFDRVLIEEFKNKRITLIVKGGPIINDVTLEDVEIAGLRDKVDVGYMGNGMPGTGPDRTDPLFLEKLEKADLVLSKGQGNFEGLNEQDYIYFLLMAKCPLIARHIGV
ncbi:MAG: ARMT1-like domain-containing protein, partial [Candidatus Altiarchaeota archaeon]|nr:ARMT1-like domain-containing protein [Candidatus Altiarchaeota archaeon]